MFAFVVEVVDFVLWEGEDGEKKRKERGRKRKKKRKDREIDRYTFMFFQLNAMYLFQRHPLTNIVCGCCVCCVWVEVCWFCILHSYSFLPSSSWDGPIGHLEQKE